MQTLHPKRRTARSKREYPTRLNEIRIERGYTWEQLGAEIGCADSALIRTANTPHQVFINATTGQEIAVRTKSNKAGGLLSPEALEQLAIVLKTTLAEIFSPPEKIT